MATGGKENLPASKPDELNMQHLSLGQKSEPFIEGWEIVDVLGEGAYGEVKLARHQVHNEYVAVKTITITDQNKDLIRKEVGIMKCLEHKNIIKFYGQRSVDKRNQVFIFLEYAENGELFDRIEPEIGMPRKEMFKYFTQLLEGVEFIHEKGIVHRDIKPENLLIDKDMNLRISDFGLATLFRCKGKERKLNTVCGTPCYSAPEVLEGGHYYAEPIDVWSCGIVLLAMLTGELPWDEPKRSCKEFDHWAEKKHYSTPWCKIDAIALGFFLKLLHLKPAERLTIVNIRKETWYVKLSQAMSTSRKRQYSPGSSPIAQSPSRPFKLACSRIENSPCRKVPVDFYHAMPQSQPVLSSPVGQTPGGTPGKGAAVSVAATDFVMSQPNDFGSMAITQTGAGSVRKVNRMTRFYTKGVYLETLKAIQRFLEHNGISYKVSESVLTASVVDSRSNKLVWKINIITTGDKELNLVDVRRSKGDGIEFKKQFIKMRAKLVDLIYELPPLLMSSNSVT